MMIFVWSSISFVYYLLQYNIVYLPGDIMLNYFVSGFSCVFYLLQGKINKALGSHKNLRFSWIMNTVGACMIFSFVIGFDTDDMGIYTTLLFSVLIFMTKSFNTVTFGVVYAIQTELFPTYFLSSSMGISNIFARSITITAPLVAVLTQPLPQMIMFSVCIIGTTSSILLRYSTPK
jgi:hypothetical protein